MSKQKQTHARVKATIEKAWWAGVNAVNGFDLVHAALSRIDYLPVTHVIAIGKAAASMMSAASAFYQGKFKGLVITKYGHLDEGIELGSHIRVIEAAHPVPDQNSLFAGEQALRFVTSLEQSDSLLVLVSGGASALAEKLKGDMSLSDLQQFNNRLLSQTRTIQQINAARSDISLLKKGRLLNQCRAGSILTLAISDVRGDDVMVIGSGIGGCNLARAQAKVIGTNRVARQAIARYLQDANINIVCNQESLYGDVFAVSNDAAQLLINGPAGGYILGGETVINLPPNPGRGGRNQSLALAIARHLVNQQGIIVLAAGSDGTDGPTEAAGGIVDSTTFIDSDEAHKALDQANAGEYLSRHDALYVSGPTGTNVMDLLVAVKFQ